jgi:hypothetical protein
MPHCFPCNAAHLHGAQHHCAQCQDGAVNQLLQNLWMDDDEPKLVYRLFFSEAARKAWSEHLALWTPSIKYSGVFIHARPFCSFNQYGSQAITLADPNETCRCELGDVLFVYSDYLAKRRTAIIFQAKKTANRKPPRFANSCQLELYSRWPTFRYSLASKRVATRRVLRTLPFQGSHDPAAQMMLLDSVSRIVQLAPAIDINQRAGWGLSVNRFLNGSIGRDFAWKPPTRSASAASLSQWDLLIWDILSCTYNQAMPRGIAGTSGRRRGLSLRMLESSMVDSTGGDGPGDVMPTDQANDGFIMPIVHLIRPRFTKEG